RERRRDQLEPWLTAAEASGVPEFREFARVMRRDYAAVAAALSSAWSNGQTEGQITRLNNVSSDGSGGSFPSVARGIGLRSSARGGERVWRGLEAGDGDSDERRSRRVGHRGPVGTVPGGRRHRTGAGVHSPPAPVVPAPEDRGRLRPQPRPLPRLLPRQTLRALAGGRRRRHPGLCR
ncbi:MAG TPA: transposase, partial [Thermomicrobiaceae bacterium]|nr:transposase [Thermomicrobiaceae bacterium]